VLKFSVLLKAKRDLVTKKLPVTAAC